jgi:transcriptional regulator with XRE-family HTH domain
MRWLGCTKQERGGPKPRLSIEQFADAIGVNVTTARRWLRATARPDGEHLRRIHALQGVTRATYQRELFDEDPFDDRATERRAIREARLRFAEDRLKREIAEAMKPIATPVEDEAEQKPIF